MNENSDVMSINMLDVTKKHAERVLY